MKWGIHGKLIGSFLMVILVPLLVTIGALAMSVNRILDDESLQSLLHIPDFVAGVVDRIERQYIFINNYDAFSYGIRPMLVKFNGHLIVVDNDGFLLFDSEDREASIQRTWISLDIISGPEETASRPYPAYNWSSHALVVDNTVVANAVLVLDMNAAVQSVLLHTVQLIGGSFLLGLAVMIAMILGLTVFISRGITVPLRELYAAVDRITDGDIHFEITYNRNNELGRLCRAFSLMGRRLRASLKKQEEEAATRKDLIAGISHDLRTPIASIKGYVEGLKDGIVTDKEMFDRYLSVIADKTDKLDSLIDDLFQFSQLELEDFKLDLEVMDSRALLHGIFKAYELDFLPHIHFTVIEPLPSIPIYADIRRIAQVADNILQNAKRVVPDQGSITAGALLEGEYVKVYVKDNGCGISPKDLPHIFDRFYRGEKSRSRQYGGTGLGLAICKKIIEDHRGEIWADSTPGQGTVFYFTLPVLKSGRDLRE